MGLYGSAPKLSTSAEGPAMARLREEHHRILGNGYCTRPVELDCAFETICEGCTFFATTIEFRPTLRRHHKDAGGKHRTGRAAIFKNLLSGLDSAAEPLA